MIFATDLDNTMIFSHRLIEGHELRVRCVEYYNDKPTTYMTHTAIGKIKSLMKRVHVIPITTRSMSQFKRIKFFSATEFAVVDNGGTILQNGSVVKVWKQYIDSILQEYNFADAVNAFSSMPSLTLQPKIVDEKFIFAKSADVDSAKRFLEARLDTSIWQLSFQGQKVYAIPIQITKGNALKYISENLISDSGPVVAAGDSNLDVSMLEYSSYSLIPADSRLVDLKNTRFIEAGAGIYSADAILDFVINLSNK